MVTRPCIVVRGMTAKKRAFFLAAFSSCTTFSHFLFRYKDGANFDSNPKLANYLYLLLKHGVTIAVVTAAGYEYETKKYELRLSGLLDYFQSKGLSEQDCERFYLFGGECNYLMVVRDCVIVLLLWWCIVYRCC